LEVRERRFHLWHLNKQGSTRLSERRGREWLEPETAQSSALNHTAKALTYKQLSATLPRRLDNVSAFQRLVEQ
jgi:hypothetical protein